MFGDPAQVSSSTSVPPRPSKASKSGKQGKAAAKRPATPAPAFKARKPEEHRSLPTSWVIGGVIAVLVVVVGIIAIVSSTGGDGNEDTASWSQTRPVAVTGATLAPAADTDPEVGGAVPSFTGAAFDGTAISWSPGTPTLFVLLAHWCPHCQVEVPLLVAWKQAGRVPAGLDVIGVATNTASTRDNYPPSDWLAREGWPWPVVADSENYDLAAAMGVLSFPNYVLVDAAGTVVWRSSGELPIELLQTQVDAVVAV